MPWSNLDRGLRIGRRGALHWNEWRRALCSLWRHGQAIKASLPRVTRHDSSGSNPKKEAGSRWLLPEVKTRWGTASTWLTAVASLLQAWTMASGGSGTPLAWRSHPTSSLCPPLASRSVQWLKSVTNSLNLVAARVRWVLSFAGKIHAMGCAIYRGF
jgi:hypothetical protein